MKRIEYIFLLSVLLAVSIVAGCVSSPVPTPTPVPTATPTPAATVSPAPTLIGGSDEAHIRFNYQLGTASEYGGLQKASEGNLLYLLQVKVSSDKPVQTSQDWFWIEYKVNESDSVHTSHSSISFVKYPAKVIGNNSDSARGELIFELPANMAPGYPKPYYYMPLEDQQGPYKVYDKVYGEIGDVQ